MAKSSTQNGMKISRKTNVVLNIIFILMCLAFLYPVLLTVVVSFTSEASLMQKGYSLFPQEWSLDGYKFAIASGSILNAYKVTIFVSIVGTLASVLVMQMYAYVISRKDFSHRMGFTFFAYFSSLFSGGIVPWYIVCTQYLHLNDKIWGLIVPSLANAFYIIILRTFISTNVPDEMLQAAKIDGAGEFKIFFKMIMPLSKPGLATVGLFQLLYFWNDYWLAMMLIKEKALYPLQYFLQVIFMNIQMLSSGQFGSQGMSALANMPRETTRMAMCVLTMGPILIAYPFFQKYFIQGMTIGSVKG